METFPTCTSSESLCPGGLAFNNIIACVDSGPDVEFLGIQARTCPFCPRMSWHKAHETRGQTWKGPRGVFLVRLWPLTRSLSLAELPAHELFPLEWSQSFGPDLIHPLLWPSPGWWELRSHTSLAGSLSPPSTQLPVKLFSTFYLVLKRQVWCSLLNLNISINTSKGGIVRFYSQEINPAFASQSMLWLQRLYNLLAKQSVQLNVDLHLLPAWKLLSLKFQIQRVRHLGLCFWG